eukprot:INCI15868.2.p1 GENE.INCI15868.2~~INCI15868.2.p1  ORF type:complete len:272 (-),score=41.02 INCI15868.2:127-942(-)
MKISPLVVGTAFLGSVSAGPPELPLDGSTKSGTLSQNQYDYYTISSEDSGDVTITTTVTANPIGVWTWIGRDYQPVDGNSDWNQGAIINYPAKQTVENLEPNETYYVGVQGIGSPTASYTISATIDNKPYTPPTSIKVDDDLPITGQISDQFQYLFFIADIPEDGNYTISVNPSSNSFSTSEKRPANEKHGTVVKTSHGPTRPLTEDVYLLGSNLDLPTLGHRQWENSTSRYNTWTTLECPFLRKDSKLGISVKTRVSQLTFYLKVDSQKE